MLYLLDHEILIKVQGGLNPHFLPEQILVEVHAVVLQARKQGKQVEVGLA